MATFVMQTLGCEVAGINTVQFSKSLFVTPVEIFVCSWDSGYGQSQRWKTSHLVVDKQRLLLNLEVDETRLLRGSRSATFMITTPSIYLPSTDLL